jgi:Protein of unknown function (DUF3710)
VGIFRRGTKDTNAADTNAADTTAALSHPTDAPGSDDAADVHGSGQTDSPVAGSQKPGPFDRSDVAGLEGRLDLGSLWLTGAPGMELRLELEQESQNVVGVTAVLGESAVQLQAFAAPRSEGVWADIRTEIAASITSQGGTADMTSGPMGTELQARMPGQSPDGRTVFSPARFIGIDGPRWFLRAVLTGRAAIDEDAASALLDMVRATVVVRGPEAMAPRELLPLRLPDQPGPADEDVVDEEPSAPNLSDLNPFERGPEIIEIH